jgi:hypothetical protein
MERKRQTIILKTKFTTHLSPVSGMMARTELPSGKSFAMVRAAVNTPPPLVPVKKEDHAANVSRGCKKINTS